MRYNGHGLSLYFFPFGLLNRPLLFLDWHIDQVTPLGPRAIVIAHIWIAQQVVQNEPYVEVAAVIEREGLYRT